MDSKQPSVLQLTVLMPFENLIVWELCSLTAVFRFIRPRVTKASSVNLSSYSGSFEGERNQGHTVSTNQTLNIFLVAPGEMLREQQTASYVFVTRVKDEASSSKSSQSSHMENVSD